MYITKLENWDRSDWKAFYRVFPWLDEDDKFQVKQILTLPMKISIENSFEFLKNLWVINGIWPWYLWACFRAIISKIFKWVRYEWHDIMYAIGGDSNDRYMADKWLLKYSKETIRDNIDKVHEMDGNPLSEIFILLAVYIASILQYWIVLVCYSMVRIFGKSAFRSLN